MPIVYVNLNKQENCLSKEPYLTFLKKFEVIRENPDGEQIELRVGGQDETFTNGFYVDKYYFKNPRLTITFAKVPSCDDGKNSGTFIRVCYSYEGEDGYDLNFHLQRVKDIKKRAPYYYLPGAARFEFSSQVDDDYKLLFDAYVEDADMVKQVCLELISLVITIFSLDN